MIRRGLFRRLLTDRQGNIALIFALVLPFLAMITAAGVELAFLMVDRSKMQGVADSAALYGARGLAVTSHEGVIERAKAFAMEQLTSVTARSTVTVDGQIDPKTKSLTINIASHRMSFFGSMLPPGGFHVGVKATAIGMGSPLCVLAISEVGKETLNAKDSADLNSPDCAVQSNGSIYVEGAAKVAAASVSSVGASSGNIIPGPHTGAQIIDDPFADIAITPPAACTGSDDKIHITGTMTLAPGKYCGKVEIAGGTLRLLGPGEFFFTKELNIKQDGVLWAQDAVIILTKDAKLKVQDRAKLELDGRKTGSLAGFVLIAARDHVNDVEIMSENARKLHGAIYVPAAKLLIDGKDKVAEQSPWTVVVAKEIQMKGDSTLVINADYGGSPLPVPKGVGPNGSTRLLQ